MNKLEIAALVKEKLEKTNTSQADLAKILKVSTGSISLLVNGKLEDSSPLLSKALNWLGENIRVGWQPAHTPNFVKISKIAEFCQLTNAARAVSFHPATGKTFAAKHYANNNPDAFYVCATGDMGKRAFLEAIASVLGLGRSYRLADMMEDIINKLHTLDNALLIFDEFDELNDNALRVFKDLYNHCSVGILIIGGMHLRKRIERGCAKTKQSYQEIFSRLGREFADLQPTRASDIKAIAQANGIMNEQVAEIVTSSDSDLRRAKALILALKGKGGNHE